MSGRRDRPTIVVTPGDHQALLDAVWPQRETNRPSTGRKRYLVPQERVRWWRGLPTIFLVTVALLAGTVLGERVTLAHPCRFAAGGIVTVPVRWEAGGRRRLWSTQRCDDGGEPAGPPTPWVSEEPEVAP